MGTDEIPLRFITTPPVRAIIYIVLSTLVHPNT